MVQELCATPYTSIQTCVLVSFMMFYDAKPQLVKTPVEVNQAQYHQITHANVHY